ncbi:MAG: undecaprenyldiphospho-muramoylpentapeptide beta-N-acetylglucosaminyltransferase [Treponema sp.]|jgi:UDP-N-acetylglucosamine--N-acetylmuramyl-(pentapeptide) pyrophosphoryl-undecaprenol N-acetylglucosamine transferase|nr:undecaprenyldiphospho-muramoylpentapeptide beta-N-acetylglucosaminyltransferase [Treponema sp.]
MVNIAFTGGGTGGHIYPGLAVAAELKKQLAGTEFRIFWIGSCAGIDKNLVEEAGIEFFGVPSGKLRRYFSLKTAADFFRVIAGFFAARKILKKQKTVLLFSKGGFVSVPPCAAAASLNIPVFTHESDFSPGLATKINARFVLRAGGRIFTAYEDTASFFPEEARDRVTVTGNPVRSAFRSADTASGRAFLKVGENTRILLVLGGSQGALEINELVRTALPELTEIYTVVHQTGPNQQWELGETERYKPYPYIKEEMSNIMAAAEIVLGRSGAGIWEWAVSGKPMILIPLTGSGTRGDQVENARYFEKAGAAQVLTGEDVNPQALIYAVKSLAHNAEKREIMAKASFKTGERDGAGIIARVLAEQVKYREGK